MKLKLRKTLNYITKLSKRGEDGYFYIDMENTALALDISRMTLYRHLDSLGDHVFKVYNGSFIPDELTLDVLRDSGKTIKTIRGLYYVPQGEFDGQYKRDFAILRYCFGWNIEYIEHFNWVCNCKNLEYDVNLYGLSEVTKNNLRQYFKYMVKQQFNVNDECYDDIYEKFCSL